MARTTVVRKYTANQAHKLMNGEDSVKTPEKNHVYKIENNIPIPKHQRQHKYPLFELLVGDSFVVPMSEANYVRAAIGRAHRTNKAFRFITRTVVGRGRAGKQVRVWRIGNNQ